MSVGFKSAGFKLGKMKRMIFVSMVLATIVVFSYSVAYMYSQRYEANLASFSRDVGSSFSCRRLGYVPRNIILLIGDGMGFGHVYATHTVYGYTNMSLLFNNVGIAFTNALDNIVPDSAGAGTAIATGFKTLNRMVSMVEIEDKETPVTTVLELAKWLGMSVGVVTTTRVTHATPAVFTAHVPHRDMEQEIAVQQVALEVDVILGGGRRYYTESIVAEAKRRGYTLVFNRSALISVDPNKTKRLIGLFADSHIPYVLDRDKNIPNLVEMTAKAIEILEKNPCGFFLMIEGGRIDHAAHSNDIASVIAETKEFDNLVGFVVSYARSRGDTLVVVVADHETGGLTIGLGVETPTNIRQVLSVKASAEKIASEIKKAKTVHEVKDIIHRYTTLSISDNEASEILSNPTAPVVGRIISRHFGVLWSSTDHTGEPVPVLAYGPSATLFSGIYHQTYIAKTIAKLVTVGDNISVSYTVAKSPTRGDVNGDGVLDVNDIIMLLHFVGENTNESSRVADMNLNRVIDLEDVYILVNQIMQKNQKSLCLCQ